MKLLVILVLTMLLRPEHVVWMRADWTRGIKHLLGVEQWEGQKRVVRALQKHRRVAVTSGHKVGKTHTVGSIVNTLMTIYPNARIITTASTSDQVTENVWGEIREQARHAPAPISAGLLPQAPLWRKGPLWYAKGLSTDNPESFQGKHSEEGIVVVIMDECQSIPREIVTAALSMTSDANGYLLAIANPTIPSGWFYDACATGSEWHRVTLSVYDHPNIVQGRKVMPGPTQQLVRTFEGTAEEGPRLRGDFNEEGTDRLISLKALRACEEIADEKLENDAPHMGVDISDQGSDDNVACIQKRRRVAALEAWKSPGTDGLMKTVGRIQALAHQHGVPPENVHIDGIGVGAGVGARLHELGFHCELVIFGGGPKGDWSDLVGPYHEFLNRRAELHWVAKLLIERQLCSIPAKFAGIQKDLAAPGWSYVSDRKVKIEAKEDIKERIDRSPDKGDAFIYSLSRANRLVVPAMLKGRA